ncbi:hypothetical protein BTZ20_3898 [Rhodococcus sp. MTM3W5.2]|nr:hypothetical protein BTZ20_3898 [Rhodococcus sp. MTM3W5.2]
MIQPCGVTGIIIGDICTSSQRWSGRRPPRWPVECAPSDASPERGRAELHSRRAAGT